MTRNTVSFPSYFERDRDVVCVGRVPAPRIARVHPVCEVFSRSPSFVLLPSLLLITSYCYCLWCVMCMPIPCLTEELAEGKVRVQWLDSYAPTDHDLAQLTLVSRSFMHADVVARASDARGQTGTVVGLDLTVTVQSLTSKRVEAGVSVDRLAFINKVQPGAWVVRGTWLGRVEDCSSRVYLKFSDGATCYVSPA